MLQPEHRRGVAISDAIQAHDFPTARCWGSTARPVALDSVRRTTLWLPREDQLHELLGGTCRWLARAVDGTYQVVVEATVGRSARSPRTPPRTRTPTRSSRLWPASTGCPDAAPHARAVPGPVAVLRLDCPACPPFPATRSRASQAWPGSTSTRTELDRLAGELEVIVDAVARCQRDRDRRRARDEPPDPADERVPRGRRRGAPPGRRRARRAPRPRGRPLPRSRRSSGRSERCPTPPSPATPPATWPPSCRPARSRASRSTQAHLDRIAAVDGAVHAFLHVSAEEALATARRVDDASRRRRARCTARRCADRGQGRRRHQGHADDGGLEDPRGLGPAVRRDAGRAAQGRRACRSSARRTWTSSPWARPPSTRRTARRTTRGTSTRIPGGSGGGSPRPRRRVRGAAGHRHRHRRLDPPARRRHRHGRREAHLRRCVALRPHRPGVLEPGPGGPGDAARSSTRRCCTRSSAATTRRDSTSLPEPLPDVVGAARRRERRPHRRARRRRQGTHGRGVPARRARALRRPPSPSCEEAGAEMVEVSCPPSSTRWPPTTSSCPAEASVQPGQVRRHAVRPARRAGRGPGHRRARHGRHARRRASATRSSAASSSAPTPCPPATTTPTTAPRRRSAPSSSATSPRRSSGPTSSSRRRRPPPRSARREARRPAGDVPQRHRDHPGQPGRHPGHVPAERPVRRRPAGRVPDPRPGAGRRPAVPRRSAALESAARRAVGRPASSPPPPSWRCPTDEHAPHRRPDRPTTTPSPASTP